jgi:hypothetical protein
MFKDLTMEILNEATFDRTVFDACEHSFPAAHCRELQALAGDRAAVSVDPRRSLYGSCARPFSSKKYPVTCNEDNLSTDLLPGFNVAVETIFQR